VSGCEPENPVGEPSDADGDVATERPIDRFRRSAAGSVIAAGLLGVRDALEGRPEREEPAIVVEAPSQPHAEVELMLDPDDPTMSRVVIRRSPGGA
jgi:hypothetical protein